MQNNENKTQNIPLHISTILHLVTKMRSFQRDVLLKTVKEIEISDFVVYPWRDEEKRNKSVLFTLYGHEMTMLNSICENFTYILVDCMNRGESDCTIDVEFTDDEIACIRGFIGAMGPDTIPS